MAACAEHYEAAASAAGSAAFVKAEFHRPFHHCLLSTVHCLFQRPFTAFFSDLSLPFSATFHCLFLDIEAAADEPPGGAVPAEDRHPGLPKALAAKATRWWRLAAVAGDVRAAYRAGLLLEVRPQGQAVFLCPKHCRSCSKSLPAGAVGGRGRGGGRGGG